MVPRIEIDSKKKFKFGNTSEVRGLSKAYIVTVKKVLAGGNSVLLDGGANADMGVGDIFAGIDGGGHLKIPQIVENGSIAEVVDGTPTEGQVYKSSDE